MKISIITPSYNQEAYIEKTIQSVLGQFGDFELEYIIIDGSSTDNSLEIIKRYESRLKWISEPDNGQTDAINKGFQIATGDIVAYLNSDDLYLPKTLHKVATYFRDNTDKNWVTGKCNIIDKNNVIIRKKITAYKNFLLKRYSYNLLLSENFVSQPATFWRKSALNKIGLLTSDHHLVMDYEYWLRLGEHFSLGVLDDYLASFRWYEDSKSGSMYKRQFKEGLSVAKIFARKKNKKWPIALHYFNYFKIVTSYNMMRLFRTLHRRKYFFLPT